MLTALCYDSGRNVTSRTEQIKHINKYVYIAVMGTTEQVRISLMRKIAHTLYSNVKYNCLTRLKAVSHS